MKIYCTQIDFYNYRSNSKKSTLCSTGLSILKMTDQKGQYNNKSVMKPFFPTITEITIKEITFTEITAIFAPFYTFLLRTYQKPIKRRLKT